MNYLIFGHYLTEDKKLNRFSGKKTCDSCRATCSLCCFSYYAENGILGCVICDLRLNSKIAIKMVYEEYLKVRRKSITQEEMEI